jgi:atypical dual specificity phosphatase
MQARNRVREDAPKSGGFAEASSRLSLALSDARLPRRYVHGKALKDSPAAFDGAAEQEATAGALGRVLVLDLLLRNEDRLGIKRLGWQENAGNLRYTERPFITTRTPAQQAAQTAAVADAALKAKRKAEGGVKGRAKAGSAGSKPRVATILEAEGLSLTGGALHKRSVSAPNVREIQEATWVDPTHAPKTRPSARGSVVVIDSGIPRRPPAAKMEADRENFPKLMELLLCDADVAAEILREISSGHLLRPPENTAEGETTPAEAHRTDPHGPPAPSLASSSSPPASPLHPPKPPVVPAPLPAVSLGSPEQSAERRVVEAFQRGVREGLAAVQLLRPLLSRLHQRLDGLLRAFIACIGEVGKADLRPSPPAHRRLSGAGRTPSPDSRKPPSPKEPRKPPSPRDAKLPPPPGALRTAGRGGSASPGSDGREPGSPLRGSPLRFTIRLKDWQKVAKVSAATRQFVFIAWVRQ